MNVADPEFDLATADGTDGRHGLRLVKLRLALTLIAVAILPLAALAPIIRSVVDDPRVAQQERLGAQSDLAAASIRRELDGITSAVRDVATGDGAAAAVAAKPGSTQAKAVLTALTPIVNRPSEAVSAVIVVDSTGAAHATAGTAPSGATPVGPSPGGLPGPIVVHDAGGSLTAIEVWAPIAGTAGKGPAGAVVALIAPEPLVRWAGRDLLVGTEQLGILDGTGNQVTTVAAEDAGASPGTPLPATAGGSSTLASAVADLPVGGLDGWRVVASAPQTVATAPLPPLVALLALLLLLIGATVLMARKIIEPAAELEAQRFRFQSLYHSARAAALRDNLTGLGNHRAFQEEVARMVEQSRRYGTRFALILLDIDEFKRVNDTRGHATGDELLAEVGNLIRATMRGSDAAFRIGGDEFALLLAETDTVGASVLARRILSHGLDEGRPGTYREAISFSAGVTACPEFGMTRLELTAQADAALYRGKRGGRTVVTVFDPALDRGHVDEGMRAELSVAVAMVIESRGLTPVYQPIVHLPTGRILGYEGLVRVDPASGFPHTGALFDAAEVAGRVLELDRAALEVVLNGASALPPSTLLSLNVSPRSFEAPEFNATVFLAILRRHEIAPDRVLLELTERDAIRDPDRLRETIHALQVAGVRVAADDVGAGNAGLRLLSQFRFDVVKIDLSLVQGGTSGEQTLNVLTSLVGLARRWGALTIAEGVETAAQLRTILGLGIDAGQGYLLGRPGPLLPIATVDLDGLLGAVPVGEPVDDRWPTRPRPKAAFLSLLDEAEVVSAPQVPTAASVIAGRGPSVFNSGS
jgi:diguanylate cyclase (GGDEF)-like protein